MSPPGAVFDLKIHQNAFVVGRGFAPDPTGGAYSDPQTYLVLGVRFVAGEKRGKEEGRGGNGSRERKGEEMGKERSPILFVTI